MRRPLITFTTDFGLTDWFVGTIKGVALGISPQAQIIDITHSTPPGNVRAGAFAIRSAFRYFPKGTIHVAVVDPGVGSNRRAIAVRTRVKPEVSILPVAEVQWRTNQEDKRKPVTFFDYREKQG